METYIRYDIPLNLWPCGILPYLGSNKSRYSMGACAIIIYDIINNNNVLALSIFSFNEIFVNR